MTLEASAGQLSFFDADPKLGRQPRPASQTAALRKSNGQFLAARRAGKLWQENAIVALRKYLGAIQSMNVPTFTFEDFRTYCEIEGMPEPASLCAWGALPSVACKLGLCQWTGTVRAAVRPASHGRLIKVWIAK